MPIAVYTSIDGQGSIDSSPSIDGMGSIVTQKPESNYILQESGFRILLEDGSGAILRE